MMPEEDIDMASALFSRLRSSTNVAPDIVEHTAEETTDLGGNEYLPIARPGKMENGKVMRLVSHSIHVDVDERSIECAAGLAEGVVSSVSRPLCMPGTRSDSSVDCFG
jgi:hypothetical protein